MTDDQSKIQDEHRESHEETLKILKESDIVLKDAQESILLSRIRLQNATKKYEERLHGPTDIGRH